jgi:hypothetical protein
MVLTNPKLSQSAEMWGIELVLACTDRYAIIIKPGDERKSTQPSHLVILCTEWQGLLSQWVPCNRGASELAFAGEALDERLLLACNKKPARSEPDAAFDPRTRSRYY